ncbi:hypothetical protein MTR67_008883 [Solanum verrucosum]|uniref:Reverse transcriptase domain-containing protein n=1 Tax=Solanum verrucosum TaxID=315347 RepID=A0AAF0Q336_SOLVR|nr:hypothetical protein MTR67_008883 [Solanum verrucosum]
MPKSAPLQNSNTINIKQVPLQRLVSDHVPIALQYGSWEVPKSYFNFQNWWLTNEGYVDKVSDWWSSFEFSGRPDYIFASKLKALKGKLKEWSRCDQGNLKLQKSRLLNHMADLDSILDSRILTEEEVAKKGETIVEPARIKEEIVKFYTDKAPGPNSYPMGFYIKCWEVLKHDITQAFHNFHSKEMFEESFNATYIAMIPKKKGAKELKDFRPISLVGSFYKLVSKVLTERLKRVVDTLVDSQQMAFIGGRHIMDAVLIANEAVDSRISQKKLDILCKLDIENACDHVNWEFILQVLRQMGFGAKWVNWVKFCISTVKFSILVNGGSEGFFNAQLGIRQGDPMSLLVHFSHGRS